MEKLTKTNLAKQTKQDLTRLGKVYNLTLSPSVSKDAMITAILTAEKKKLVGPATKKAPAKAKKSAAKAAAPKAAAKKSAAAKTASAKKSAAKAPAKSAVAPKAAKATVKKTAKKAVAKAPSAGSKTAAIVAAKTTVKPSNAARLAPPPSPKAGLAAPKKTPAVNVTATPVPSYRSGDEEMVEQSKYHVATAQERLETATIPDRYEDNRIHLLPRDPFWIHAFWDLHPAKPAETAHRNGVDPHQCRFAVRVYDVTDIRFNGGNAHKHFDIDVQGLKAQWYINLPEDDRSYLAEIGLKTPSGAFLMMARSNVLRMGRASVSDRMDEEWMIADEDFWRMYALSGGFQARGSSMGMELQEQMRQRMAGETSSGAVSSFGGSIRPRKQAQDKFWFRLDCELIVYGATEPDAKVTLAGRDIELRPDGTFTARFALPDGIQAIEAKAQSANRKFEKTITPTVTRATAVLQSHPELKEETEE